MANQRELFQKLQQTVAALDAGNKQVIHEAEQVDALVRAVPGCDGYSILAPPRICLVDATQQLCPPQIQRTALLVPEGVGICRWPMQQYDQLSEESLQTTTRQCFYSFAELSERQRLAVTFELPDLLDRFSAHLTKEIL
jgi:hypothetical protein